MLYKLTDNVEEEEEESTKDFEIRSRKGKCVIVYTHNDPSTGSYGC